MTKVAVINCGIGNVQSIYNAVHRVTEGVEIVSDAESLFAGNFDRLILPGVGAVSHYLKKLKEAGFEDIIRLKLLGDEVPFLGICVGMQILATSCDEFGKHSALNLIPGNVVKFEHKSLNLRVPHVGWNQIKVGDNAPGINHLNDTDFYFVHSYRYECEDEYIIAHTEYGIEFPSIIGLRNMFGVQFHPEKSSQAGELLLEHFIKTGSLSC